MRPSGSAPVLKSEDGRPYLNSSQIHEWIKCRYRWHLGVERTIGTRRFSKTPERGSMVHAGMAAGVRYMAQYQVPTGKRAERIAKRRNIRKAVDTANRLATEAIEAYLKEGLRLRGGQEGMDPEEYNTAIDAADESARITSKHIGEIDFDRFETVMMQDRTPLIELGLTMPLPRRARDRFAGFHGTVDWVALDREVDAVFNIDYKVREQYTPPEAEEVNLQQAMYQRLLLSNGVMTDGTMMFQIKAAYPREPELLKSGQALSRADINSDWPTYEAVILRHGFNPADYEDMKGKLALKEWRRLERTYRSETEIRSIWSKIVVPIAIELAHIGGGIVNATQRSWNHMTCMGCWARDFCLAEVHGEDTDFLLETKYVDWSDPKQRVVLNPNDFIFEEG